MWRGSFLYGILTSNFVVRLLSSPTCPILAALGKKISFEIAIGLNGRVWVLLEGLFVYNRKMCLSKKKKSLGWIRNKTWSSVPYVHRISVVNLLAFGIYCEIYLTLSSLLARRDLPFLGYWLNLFQFGHFHVVNSFPI